MINDPKILGLAFLGGVVPSLLWLWFWLNEDKEEPEPKGIIFICFILGMASVIFTLPIQKFIQGTVHTPHLQILGWASVEEIIKYLTVIILLYRTNYINKPIDWPIFLITSALGFAALENMLFLIKPLSLNQATVGLLTGYLRFLGSTLLHAVSSGILGIMIGLSFYLNKFIKKIHLLLGFIMAITLHSVFNFFIMKDSGSGFLQVFTFLWVVTIINLLLFEKLRRMSID
ncbi:MAG: PrsW family glutamic-type intramembrane protease [Candidatus Paceibacterota bacterium]